MASLRLAWATLRKKRGKEGGRVERKKKKERGRKEGREEGRKKSVTLLKSNCSQALVVHTYNPSYSEGRDQKAHGLKPASGKQFARPYPKKNPS
jgi:hypothetical protein